MKDKLYTIMLPLQYPDESTIDKRKIEEIQKRMSNHFGGLTSDDAEGRWKDVTEPVLELEAVRDNPTDKQVIEDSKFMKHLAEKIRRDFNQEAVMKIRDNVKVDFIS